jgi:uncharacterized tellurite resistance protein B-like protein
MKSFNTILLKTAILSMAIDGEIHEKELEFFHQFSSDNVYFEEFDLDSYFKKAIVAIKKDVEGFIITLTNEVKESDLDKQLKLIIVDVILAIIQSDEVIDDNEIVFLNRMLEIFDIDKRSLISRHPDLKEVLEENDGLDEIDMGVLDQISEV